VGRPLARYVSIYLRYGRVNLLRGVGFWVGGFYNRPPISPTPPHNSSKRTRTLHISQHKNHQKPILTSDMKQSNSSKRLDAGEEPRDMSEVFDKHPVTETNPFPPHALMELGFLGDRLPTKVTNYTSLSAVLTNISKTGTIMKACHGAGMNSFSYRHLKASLRDEGNDTLDQLELMAFQIYQDVIQQAIHDRAIEGWEEPVYYKGEEIGKIRRYSDRLLLAQAKRHIPEYRDDNGASSPSGQSTNVGVMVVNVPAVTAEEWQQKARKIVENKSK